MQPLAAINKTTQKIMCKLINTKLGQIEYSIKGAGIPVLLINGGHSNCRETMFQKGWDLSKYMLIQPSRPGYGKTPLNENTTPEKAAELFNELLINLEIYEKVIVVGISAGGLTAIAFSSEFSDRTCSLILISAVTKKWLSKDDDLYKKGMNIFSPKIEKWTWKLYRAIFRLFPKKMTEVLFHSLSINENPEITEEEIKEIKEMTFSQSSGSGFVTDLNQDLDKHVIEKITCPTLILHSVNDKSVSKEMAIYANEKIAKSELKTCDNKWGHLLWLGNDSQIPIRDMNDFLKENVCC